MKWDILGALRPHKWLMLNGFFTVLLPALLLDGSLTKARLFENEKRKSREKQPLESSNVSLQQMNLFQSIMFFKSHGVLKLIIFGRCYVREFIL